MKTLLCAALLILAAGCGKSDEEKLADAFENVTDDLPSCSEIWVASKSVSDDYDGCKDADGDIAVALSYDCDDGSTMFVHGDDTRFWTVDGKVATGSEEDYSAAFGACKS